MSKQATLDHRRELREQRRAERCSRAARERPRAPPAGALGAAAAAAAVASSSARDRRLVVAAARKPPRRRPRTSAPSLFAGIPEHDGVLGDPKAPLTVTEYVDLQCPICAEASHARRCRRYRSDYVRTGKVKLAGAHAALHRPRLRARRPGGRRRERQGRLWPFLEAFYAAPGRRRTPAT